MKTVYKILVEARAELPFFQVLGVVIRMPADLESAELTERIRLWMDARGEVLLSIDSEETRPLREDRVPQEIRDGSAEIAPVSGRIFHPEEGPSLFARVRRWLS